MFWAAPTKTASISGVVPSKAATGSKVGPKMFKMKNMSPVIPIICTRRQSM